MQTQGHNWTICDMVRFSSGCINLHPLGHGASRLSVGSAKDHVKFGDLGNVEMCVHVWVMVRMTDYAPTILMDPHNPTRIFKMKYSTTFDIGITVDVLMTRLSPLHFVSL